MKQSKKTAICLLCSFSALLFGLIIYIFCRQGTHIHTALQSWFGLTLPTLHFGGFMGKLARNWLGDFLWSFSLCFLLAEICRPFRHRIGLAILVPITLGTFLEILQLYGVITGTADIWDILIEAAAAFCAGIILKRGNLL